jgi:hypothetical protein
MKPTPKPKSNAAENPRMLLAKIIDERLGSRRSRNGPLAGFLDRLRINLGLTEADLVSYRNFVWLVRAGRKPIPETAEAAWARALGLVEGSRAWAKFHETASAARAWGKVNGREHLARLEARVAELEAMNGKLAKRLAHLTWRRNGSANRLGEALGEEPEVIKPPEEDEDGGA